MLLLKNKTAVITGATKGIGREIAKTFASEGARVIATGRDIGALKILMTELEQLSHEHLCFEMDVRHKKSIEDVFQDLKSRKIHIDILVNNAGVMKDSTLLSFTEKIYNDNFSANTLGTILVTQQALRSLIRNRRGSIINISSIVGAEGSKGQSVYSASKAAIIGFSKSMSKELAPLNIRVNCITPGFIETNLTQGLSEEVVRKNLNNIGLGRKGDPKDVANLAMFLASDLSSYVTGEVIGVNGGMII